MLKAKKLNKYYHNFGHKPLHVINNTSLEIPETGIIAVIGASGAGKTTLINAISGLDSYKNGTIEFDDIVMKHYKTSIADKLRMKNFGFIFQNYYLLENQTVYENVRVSLDAFDISEKEKKERINYVLTQLGIAKYTNKVVSHLSGGEQQRVSIARALVKSPRVIFADEPTGSLDEITTFNVLNIFKQISKTCAVFIVTHERDIISYYADYIIELKEGVVVKEFAPNQDEDKTLSIDQNIYLKELEHKEHFSKDNVEIDLYSDNSNSEKSDVKIAVRNGKIYLESSKNIRVLTEKSENHLIDSERKKIRDFVDSNFEYSLPPLTYSNNRIGFKEVLRKAYHNYKKKHPIKRLLKFVCVSLSIVTMALLEGMNTIDGVDLSDALNSSKNNIYITLAVGGYRVDSLKMNEARETICQTILNSGTKDKIFFEAADRLVYEYDGFMQMRQPYIYFPSHDFKDITSLSKRTITYGSMPKKPNEIVIDEYILNNILDDVNVSGFITDYGFFVGKTITSTSYDYEFIVSGVCRTKNPTIYGYEGLNFARLSAASHVDVIDVETAKQYYPELGDISVEVGHRLTNENTAHTNLYTFIDDGTFPGYIPFDHIINKQDFNTIRLDASNKGNDIYLQTNGSSKTIQKYKTMMKSVQNTLTKKNIDVIINVENRYQESRDEAIANLNNIISSVQIVTYVAIGIAFILIVLSTYLSMLNQISDIAVYRSLGYSRSFLGLSYLIELGLLAFIYSLIGGAFAFLTMFVLDVIPLISYTMFTPFISVLGTSLLLGATITLIGLIPIMLVFRLTPAKIYSRFNRKING